MPTSVHIKEYFQQLNTAYKLIKFNIKYYTFCMFLSAILIINIIYIYTVNNNGLTKNYNTELLYLWPLYLAYKEMHM